MEELLRNIVNVMSGNWWASLAFLVIVLIMIFAVGYNRLSSLLIAIYLAFTVTIKSDFSLLNSPVGKTGYFLILMLIFFSVFYSFFRIGLGNGRISAWIKLTLLSVATTGLIASIILSWYPKKILSSNFSAFYLDVFTSSAAQIFWVMIPLVLLMLFKQRN